MRKRGWTRVTVVEAKHVESGKDRSRDLWEASGRVADFFTKPMTQDAWRKQSKLGKWKVGGRGSSKVSCIIVSACERCDISALVHEMERFASPRLPLLGRRPWSTGASPRSVESKSKRANTNAIYEIQEAHK